MADDVPRTWYVLQHTRGPALAEGENVFDHPGIGEHFAFLERRRAAGELVAAGPLTDVNGSGLSVLEVASIEEAERLAREDDQSVVRGVLTVVVRPWQVVMSRI